MRVNTSKAISTAIAAVIIIIVLIGAGAAVYLESLNVQIQTTTATSTATSTATTTATSIGTSTATTTATSIGTSTATTTATTTATSTATSVTTSYGGGIPPNTIIVGEVGETWGSTPTGTDVTMMWATASSWPVPVYEQLFQFDPAQMKNGEYGLIPWLATDASQSADGLTWTINLRQGVHFHTGNVMTATDVQYSLNRFILFNDYPLSVTTYSGCGLCYRGSFTAFKNVSVVSPSQIKVTLNNPDPTFLQELASPGASILDKKVLESHAVITTNGTTTYSDHGFAWFNAGQDVGTGPYQLTSFTLLQRAELTKFSQYWGGPSNTSSPVQKIIFITIADATTGRFALESGQINILDNAGGQVVHDIAQEGGFNILATVGFGRVALEFHSKGPLSDWRVRQAIQYGIDYNGMASAFSYGYDIPMQSQFYEGMPGWNSTTATYYSSVAPDTTKAKALLTAAGYPNGFSTKIYVLPEAILGIDEQTWATAMQSDLAKIGIQVQVNVVADAQYGAIQANKSESAMFLSPGSLIKFTPLSNFAAFLPAGHVIGSRNNRALFWAADTETGPGVNFTYLGQIFNQSLVETNPTLQLHDMQLVDQYVVQYGCYTPIVQTGTKVAYAMNVHGLYYNAVLQSIDTTYLTVG